MHVITKAYISFRLDKRLNCASGNGAEMLRSDRSIFVTLKAAPVPMPVTPCQVAQFVTQGIGQTTILVRLSSQKKKERKKKKTSIVLAPKPKSPDRVSMVSTSAAVVLSTRKYKKKRRNSSIERRIVVSDRNLS